MTRTRIGTAAIVGIAVLLLVLTSTAGAQATAPAGSRPVASGSPANISYSSSVDKFSLSYLQWLPSGFSASHSHTLVVFLHGMGTTTNRVRGGIGGNTIPPNLVTGASAAGVILISLNTRTTSGFYADTACGGPQEQDVLDAINHEKSLEKVSSVVLAGFSMGTVGALEIAATHASLVSGIALAGPLTDLFEEQAYLGAPIPQLQADLCGQYPAPGNTSTIAFYKSLSPLRFAPTNFSSIPIYITAGGLDTRAPNNFGLWPYAMANSTVVNSSCRFASSAGEPSGCTTTLSSLAKAHPGQYRFRFVYEGRAVHSATQIAPDDLFDFLGGTVGTGLFVANFPPTVIAPAP